VYVPQIDAYFDFIIRGERQHDEYAKHEFLRYSVSTYNISNSIGVLCNNYNYKLGAPLIEKLLDSNIRLHGLAWAKEEEIALLEECYWSKLNDSLKARVETACSRKGDQRYLFSYTKLVTRVTSLLYVRTIEIEDLNRAVIPAAPAILPTSGFG
jgi:hypothetical protein